MAISLETEAYTDPGSLVECQTVTDTVSGNSVDFRADTFNGIMDEGWLLNRPMSDASARVIFHSIKYELRVSDSIDLAPLRDTATGNLVVPAHAAVVFPVFHYNDAEEAAERALEAMQNGML